MKKNIFALVLVVLTVFGAFFPAKKSEAGVDLPFTSTLNCIDWTQNGSGVVCEGVHNDHVTNYCKDDSGSVPASINAAGNNPTGGGASGFRTPVGDGVNNGGGSATIYLNVPQPEVWIRFYLRYPLGFRWSELSYQKLIYVNQVAGKNSAIVDMFGSGSTGEVGLYIQSWGGVWHHPDHRYEPADPSFVVPNRGWDQIMGGPTGDGKWHYYEAHFKINSASGVADGIYEQWVDGTLVNSHRDVNWNASPFTAFAFNTNQKSPANGRCEYVDWDDFAIRQDGYIGPVPERAAG